MTNKLPKHIAEQLRTKIYERADDFGYANHEQKIANLWMILLMIQK